MRRVVMAEERVTLKFDGQTHQVDVDTFSTVVLNYAAVVRACAKEAGIVEPVDVYITANEPGSLDAIISVVADYGTNFISLLNENDGAISFAVACASGLFSLKKWLGKNGKVKHTRKNSDGTTTLEAENGAETSFSDSVLNVAREQPEVVERINKTFDVLEDTPAVTGFEISNDNGLMFEASAEDFPAIADAPSLESEDTVERSFDVSLTVIKLVLDGNPRRKWEFLWNGHKISATITDPKFYQNIGSYTFKIGSIMKASLTVIQKYVPAYRAYADDKFIVTRVFEVIAPDETIPLPFDG